MRKLLLTAVLLCITAFGYAQVSQAVTDFKEPASGAQKFVKAGGIVTLAKADNEEFGGVLGVTKVTDGAGWAYMYSGESRDLSVVINKMASPVYALVPFYYNGVLIDGPDFMGSQIHRVYYEKYKGPVITEDRIVVDLTITAPDDAVPGDYLMKYYIVYSTHENLTNADSDTLTIYLTIMEPPNSFEIVVDGQKDDFYSNLTGPDDGYIQLKSFTFTQPQNDRIPTGDEDLSSKIWAAWDDEWFYIYNEVTDDTVAAAGAQVYHNDEIEIKIDPVPSDSTQTSNLELRLTALGSADVPTGQKTEDLANLAESVKQFVRLKTATGYVLELAIKWSAITKNNEVIVPAEGTVFGMTIQNHDNDGTNTRHASVQWGAVLNDAAYNTPKYLGTIKFLAGNKLQFIQSNAMTGVTNPVPYDGTDFYLRVDAYKDPLHFQMTGPDDGYLQIRSYAWNDKGKPTDDADLSAKVWMAWDENWLYFYEEVKDDTISSSGNQTYFNDGFEMKIDPQPKDSLTNSVYVGIAMTAEYTPGVATQTDMGIMADSLKMTARRILKNGYVLEWAVRWEAITQAKETVSVAVDSVFGAAILNHDNDKLTGGTREASIMWGAIMDDHVWDRVKYYATVKFLPDNKLQFIPKNNVTAYTNIIPYDGSEFDRTGVEKENLGIPSEFALKRNYPNPFNPSTTISYALPKSAEVKLIVYDILGRELATLVNEKQTAGNYRVSFDGRNYASGIYFCKLTADAKVKTLKMMMLK
jgi:hypothetical protein